MLLSHTQFIENRVYDDDDDDVDISSKANKVTNGELKLDDQQKDPESVFIDNATEALRTTLKFIDESFHQVEVGYSTRISFSITRIHYCKKYANFNVSKFFIDVFIMLLL